MEDSFQMCTRSQAISKYNIKISEGMILSNEPGYYKRFF